jgi:hypothetical protein
MPAAIFDQGNSASPTWTDPRLMAAGGEEGRLAQLFNPIYANAKSSLDANFTDQLRKLRGNQAARGVLQSGVADYPVADLMKANTNALGGVQSNLANIFGNTEASRSLFNTQSDFEKGMADKGFGYSSFLADKIGNMNKPSTTQQIFSGIGQVLPAAMSLAAMF